MYIETHGIPRSIRLDQAKCLIGHQIKTFCNKNNIEIIEAPVNDHRAIGLVERLIQTIKNTLPCIKEEKLAAHAFHVKHALKIIIHQLRICKQRITKISPFEAHFGRKPNTPLSVIATKPNLMNLSYKGIINHYLDEEIVMPEEILPDDKWIGGYRSDIEVDKGMTRATMEASARERESTDGESRFLKTKAIRPIPLKERSVELNLARKIHGKRRSKKKLEGLYEVLAPGSHILKVSPTTSTIKEPGKQIVTVRNSDIAKFGTHQERQTPLKVYADRRGPRAGEKVVEELIHSHIKEFTRKQKGDKKMKHRKREPGSGVSSQRSNISRAMRGACQNCQTSLQSETLNLHSRSANRLPMRLLIHPQHHLQNDPPTVIGEARHIMVSKRHLQDRTSYHRLNDPVERVMSKILHHLSPLSNRYNKSWKYNRKSKTCHHRLVLSRLPRYEMYLC